MARLFLLAGFLAVAACAGAEVKEGPRDSASPARQGPEVKLEVLRFVEAEGVGAGAGVLEMVADQLCRGLEDAGGITCMSPSVRASFMRATALRMALGACDDCQDTLEALDDVDYLVKSRVERHDGGLVLRTTLVRKEEQVELQTVQGEGSKVEDLLDLAVGLGRQLGGAVP